MQNLVEASHIADTLPDDQPAEQVVSPDDSTAAAIPQEASEVADPRGDRDGLLSSGPEEPAEPVPADTAQKLGKEVVAKTTEVEPTTGAEGLRHGFLSFFADRLADTDPDSAKMVRQYRDTPQIFGDQGSVPRVTPDGAEREADESAAPRHEFGRSALVADSIREEREGDSKSSKGVTAFSCGKMSDLVGVEDPHSMFGGFFHDLGSLLPWGSLFETDYDRAVNEFLAKNPNKFF